MTLDKSLLSLLVCPSCKTPVIHQSTENRLICKPCKLAYPIRDDIPVMLNNEASPLTSNDIDAIDE